MSTLKTNNLQHLDGGSANIELAKGGGAIHSGISTFQEDIHLNDIVHLQDTDTKIRFPSDNTVTVETGGSERARITSHGDVGIGTNTVGNIAGRSQVVIGGDSGGLLDFNVGGTTEARLFATDATGLTIRASESDGGIIFQTGGSNQRFSIASDGKVGIGTHNPQYALDISNGAASGIRIGVGTHAYRIRTNASTSNDYGFFIEDEEGTDLYNVRGPHATSLPNVHLFYTQGAERLRIQPSGGISFNGDTATANALDDYEEGTITTWRLVKSDGNTSGSNHAQTEVQYTKIGRCVYISGHIRTDGTQTSKTGNLLLVSTADGSTAATLPFVPNHRGGLPIVHTRSCSTSDTTYGLSVGFNEGSSTVYVYANDGTGDYILDTNTLDSNTQTNLVITFNGHYFTDS